MCDDFFDDMDGFEDAMFDPNNDFEEDIAGEFFQSEDEDYHDNFLDQLESDIKNEQNITLAEAMIVGTMVVGNAMEESLDEKRRRKLLQSNDKSGE